MMADEPPASEKEDAFKVPLLKQKEDIPDESVSPREVVEEKEEKDLKTKKKSNKALINVALPYKEPEWGGNPLYGFSFEIVKNGTLISTYIITSSLLTFGRLEVCDFVFEHPSVSRYHAIVQYCKGDDTHPKGFYLYDLGSTHGTFLNKQVIKPKIYYKLKVGYILKFGGSSRLHIFQGPEETDESKSDKAEEKTDDVCSWGMGEDAVEEEDGVNPFALISTSKELQLDDPKKTLKNWFEREGYEVEYSVEEKGHQTFMCCVKLPIDTPSGEFMPVEATVSGKKKEAMVACALEACHTLDRLGLLRQSNQESRHRKKKNWEENDYYDSDEDTFYDRTGEIEKRREMRKRLTTKKKQAENFQTIESKLKLVVEEIKEIEAKLEVYAVKSGLSLKEGDEDSLEMYMSNLSEAASAPTDKFEKRKLKLRLIEVQKEQTQLEKMLNIARPTKLPPVAKHPGVIGKKPKSKLQLPVEKTEEPVLPKNTNEEEVEEEDSEEEVPLVEKKLKIDEKINNGSVEVSQKKYGLQLNVSSESEHKEPTKLETEKDCPKIISSPAHDLKNTNDKKTDLGNDADRKMEVEEEKPIKKSVKRPKKEKKSVDVYKTDSAEYCTWTPPTGQSGDGMTHLNAKYGY